jgi:hypothetical protein
LTKKDTVNFKLNAKPISSDMPINPRHRFHWFLVGLLGAIYLINGIIAIPKLSVNSDEGNHFNYAVRLLKGQPDKIRGDEDASCLPVSMLNALPRAIQQVFNPSLARQDNGVTDITHGRYLTLLAGLLLGFYIYRWSKEWYGEGGALISLTLFVFCPNLGAYAASVMTDLYGALFTVIPLYHFWRYRESNAFREFLAFAFTLALAQLAKQSLTHLYIIFFIIWLVPILARKVEFGNWREVMGKFFILLGIQILILNAGFQFRHFGKSLSSYEFKSSAFNSLKSGLGPLAQVPLPLPEPHIQGIDQNMRLVELGPGVKVAAADNYLFGEKRKTVFPYYYLAVFFFKTPIASMIAIICAFFLMVRRMNSSFWRNEFLLLFPVFYFLIYFSFMLNIQGGIRYVLMIYPLLYILCGRVGAGFTPAVGGTEIQPRRWRYRDSGFRIMQAWQPALILIGLVWLLLSFYYYSPNLLPYSNEFIADKKMAYRIMGDSNLDSGQANYFLSDFLSKNPALQPAPLQPVAGKFYIGVNELLDLYDEGKYAWLLDNFKPASHIAHSFLVFDVSKDQLQAKLGIAN